MNLFRTALAACILAVAALPAVADDSVLDLDVPAASEAAAPSPPPADTLKLTCADGSTFTCLANSSHCIPNSKVYCDFSVDLVKDIMKSHDTEIEILNSRLASLQKEHLVAESHTSKLKERIQAELQRSSKRVYLMAPKFLAGHYVATDNAIILVAICASFGVAAGVLGGALLMKPKSD